MVQKVTPHKPGHKPSAPLKRQAPPATASLPKKDVSASHEASSAGLPAIPDNLVASFTEDAKENMEHVHDAFHRISIMGSRYKVGGDVIGVQGVEFEAIILKVIPVNIFYKSKYDPENPTNPDCWSLGGEVPDVAVAEKQNDSCVTCEWNRFGTGTDQEGKRSRGKACRNARRLVLKVQDVDMPVIMSLPPTTIKTLNQYLKMLSSNNPPIPMFAVRTKFGFDAKASYPKPTLAFVSVVTLAEYVEIREYRNSQEVIDALNAYASPADVVEETEEQAQAGMEHGEQQQATPEGKLSF